MTQLVDCFHRVYTWSAYTNTIASYSWIHAFPGQTASYLVQIRAGQILMVTNQGQSQRFRDTWRVCSSTLLGNNYIGQLSRSFND